MLGRETIAGCSLGARCFLRTVIGSMKHWLVLSRPHHPGLLGIGVGLLVFHIDMLGRGKEGPFGWKMKSHVIAGLGQLVGCRQTTADLKS
jgi:hypothetical protein